MFPRFAIGAIGAAFLASLVAEASRRPERFAVDVAHPIDATSAGEWSAAGTVATWRYIVRVPSALSMSFHATRAALPPSAVLTVRAGDAMQTYRAADVRDASLWSRITVGDTLSFELVVSSSEREQLALGIDTFQVGFRPAANETPEDESGRLWKIQAVSGTSHASCVQNYACNVTSANSGPAKSVVAVVMRNTITCTGTLINNTSNDNTPYVLTARHCQNDNGTTGAPARNDVSIYWNAVTACDQESLASIFCSGAVVQTGASTVVEQEDAWLLKLQGKPAVSDAYFAGFDATGSAVIGGYTVHHALSKAKQIAGWFGQAYSSSAVNSALGGRYTSHFWQTVNERGNVGPGASGSALFDENGRLVGSLSLASITADDSGWNECPASSPSAPSGAHSVASFTKLAAVWQALLLGAFLLLRLNRSSAAGKPISRS